MNERTGVTVVLTTHNMQEADVLCERVAIVDRGTIAALDTPERLKSSLGGDLVDLGIANASKPFFDRLDAQPWIGEYTETDAGVRVTLERGETRVPDLVRIADEANVTIASVDLRRPSLENVFLSLTGSTIAKRESDTPESEPADTGRVEGDRNGADERNNGGDTTGTATGDGTSTEAIAEVPR